MTETYDRSQTYEFNYHHGPFFPPSAPTPSPFTFHSSPFTHHPSPPLPQGPMKTFLGLNVRSRLGIPAGLLLNSNWIRAYATLGWDILTYKTVRSSHRPSYPPPNWVLVDDDGQPDGPVYVTQHPHPDPAQISSSVCFGMPSMAPHIWRQDIQRAKACLAQGQLLIVSVVATPSHHSTPDQLARDFAQCALWAAQAGADIIEANLSCPNVCSPEGSIYTDVPLSRTITTRLREVLGHKPLLLKIGHFPSPDLMAQFLHAIHPLANGITLVNAISRPVLHRDGTPAFGPQFLRAGVLGRTIHKPSLQHVRLAAQIIHRHGLQLAIAAVGGVSCEQDAKDFFDAGAHIVLMGSSPMFLPALAAELKLLHPLW